MCVAPGGNTVTPRAKIREYRITIISFAAQVAQNCVIQCLVSYGATLFTLHLLMLNCVIYSLDYSYRHFDTCYNTLGSLISSSVCVLRKSGGAIC